MLKTKPIWIYSLLFLAWATITFVTMGLVLKLVLQDAETTFNRRAVELHEHIELMARDNESILEGFSAFLSAIEYADRSSASRYARQILSHYPHVYALQVALFVKQSNLVSFIERQRQTWYPRFQVKSISFDDDRRLWRPVKKKPIYTPIIFVEPMSDETELLIGADMDSIPFIKDALNRSTKTQLSVATIPFNINKGNRGYILFHPVPDPPRNNFSKRKQALSLLEINSQTIRKKIEHLAENLEVHLYHSHFSSDDPKGKLLYMEAPLPNKIESRLFQKLIFERKLDSKSQPFTIKVVKQLGWIDMNLPLLIATASTSILFLALLIVFLSSYFRREQQRQRSANRLLYMATHDSLTGLPNRMLLADRFSQACSRTHRRDTVFSTMFIDLNGFKKVNDTYGHDIGDQLLKTIGGVLKECIREEDTLSRISGDEFVILLENTSYENAEKISRKIQEKLSHPLLIRGVELNISLSLGIAVYPDDGTTMSELLRTADARMYKAKKQSKTIS